MPIGIQSFEKLRTEGFSYIDKTENIYRLQEGGGTYFFLSRPRRFGKSLFLSTLKAFFEGKRELFEGLAITQHEDIAWVEHPVFHLDLNVGNYDCSDVLTGRLSLFLSDAEAVYGKNDNECVMGDRFAGVIRRAFERSGHKVVILVDEYEKPLLEAIGKPKLQETFRDILRGFYSVMKSMDEYIEFAMLTGVTKFGHLSVFSGLNNIRDISFLNDYSDICGITEKEMLGNFGRNIQVMADRNGISYEECVQQLREMYDGYHFHQDAVGVYNPYSLINALADCEFNSYWFATGTPKYLVQLLQQYDYRLKDLSCETVTTDIINAIDSANPIPVIYQSGYLTIKGFDKRFKQYKLGFPNYEVEEGFVKALVPYYLTPTRNSSMFDIAKFIDDVESGNTEQFIDRLRALFADTPYELVRDLENHYQNVLWILFKLMGFYTHAEYHTSRGRIDLLVKTPLYIYVMEFKLDGTAEEALAQINSKEYSLPFTVEGQKVIKIGMNFSKETRNIENWVVE